MPAPSSAAPSPQLAPVLPSPVTTPRMGTFQGQVIKHHTNSQYLIRRSSLFRDKRLPSKCVAGFPCKDQVIKCSSTRISDQNYSCDLFFRGFSLQEAKAGRSPGEPEPLPSKIEFLSPPRQHH